ncbi:MAG: endonuclease V, partial [Phycisphaerae bacterium]
GGQVVGAVVRTRTGVRPLYVSIGHRITLDEAVLWTLRCTRGVRLPEPTRRADQQVARMKRGLAGRAL